MGPGPTMPIRSASIDGVESIEEYSEVMPENESGVHVLNSGVEFSIGVKRSSSGSLMPMCSTSQETLQNIESVSPPEKFQKLNEEKKIYEDFKGMQHNMYVAFENFKNLAEKITSSQIQINKNLLQKNSEQSEIMAQKETIDNLIKEKNDLEITLKVLTRNLKTANDKLDNANEEIANQSEEYSRSMENIKEEMKILKEQNQILQKNRSKRKKLIEKLNMNFETQKHKLNVENSKSQAEVNNLTGILNDQKSKLNLRQQKIETFEKNVNSLMCANSKLSTEFEDQTISLKKSLEEVDGLKKTLTLRNSKLNHYKRNIEILENSLEKSQEELKRNQEEVVNLKETVDDQKSKLSLQQQQIETFEKNMNTLKDKFLPNDGIEKTFIKLLDKFEYIIGQYTSQKEEIEHLGTQLANYMTDAAAQ